MQNKIRAKWEQEPNPDIRTLHVDFTVPEIFDEPCELAPEHPDAQLIREALGNIHGIESVWSHEKYQICFEKGRVFDWPEVIPRLISAMAELWNMQLDVSDELINATQER